MTASVARIQVEMKTELSSYLIASKQSLLALSSVNLMIELKKIAVLMPARRALFFSEQVMRRDRQRTRVVMRITARKMMLMMMNVGPMLSRGL